MDVRQKSYRNAAALLTILGVAGIVLLYLAWGWVAKSNAFSGHDIRVYYDSSRWAAGEGTLYKEVFSEYPLVANVIFGGIRFLAELWHPLASRFDSYCWLWASVSWSIYLWMAYLIGTQISVRSLWIWLAPAPLFFALSRFDIYPALTTLVLLLELRKERYYRGALWMGLTIALKGYFLFAVPAFFVFLIRNKGLATAIKVTAVCLLPLVLSNLVVFAYAGTEGLISPYKFHAVRVNNGESSYDALFFLLPFIFPPESTVVPPLLAQCLEVAVALLAAGLRPKSFDDLVDAFLLAVVGFLSFSIFYSPQFCLWVAPIACFSRSQKVRALAIAFSWLTFLYHPIAQRLNYNAEQTSQFHSLTLFSSSWLLERAFFRLTLILVTINRFCLMAVSFQQLRHRQRQPHSKGGEG